MSLQSNPVRGAVVVCLADKEGTPQAPPVEFRIFPQGSIETTKGTFLFDEASAKQVIEHRAKRGVRVRLDYEHASVHIDEAKDPAEAGKAAGWFTPEVREGELWAASVKWTPLAAQKLTDGEFAYLSPTFYAEKQTGRIVALDSVALTNDPATLGAEPLVSMSARDLRSERVALSMSFEAIYAAVRDALREQFQEAWIVEIYDDCVVFEMRGRLWRIGYVVTGQTISLEAEAVEVSRQYLPVEGGKTMKTLLKALGLKDEAGEAEALSALTKLTDGQRDLLALTGKISLSEAIGVLQAWKESHGRVETLSAELSKLKTEAVDREVTGLVDDAVKAGKLTPAQKDWATKLGRTDAAQLRAFLDTAVPVAAAARPAQEPVAPTGGAIVTLSALDLEVARQMGLEQKDVAAHKATLQQSGRA